MNLKNDIVGKIRGALPLPTNINAILSDISGSKAPITNATFSNRELQALAQIVKNNISKNKNIIELEIYNREEHPRILLQDRWVEIMEVEMDGEEKLK